MKKICIVITSRSSLSKYLEIIKLLAKYKKIKVYIILSFSAVVREFGDLTDFIKINKIKIIKLDNLSKRQTLINSIKATSLGLNFFSEIFFKIKPSLVLLMADRYEVISAAIAASYLNIKIAHLQGGELSGNIDGKVRHSISNLSDYHFVCTKKSKIILKNKNILENIYLTGCPSIDLMRKAKKNSKNYNQIIRNKMIVEKNFDFKNYLILLNHSDTKDLKNIKKNFKELLRAIKLSNLSFIIFWPNADPGTDEISKQIRVFREKTKTFKNAFVINLHPEDYFKVLLNSRGIIGNSSSGIREAGFYGLPAINLGNRQKNREKDINVTDAKYDANSIVRIIKREFKKKYHISKLYGEGKASQKIFKIIKKII